MSVDTKAMRLYAAELADDEYHNAADLVRSAADELDELRALVKETYADLEVESVAHAETRSRLESAEGILRYIKDHPYHQCMATIEAQAHFARYASEGVGRE